MKLDTPIKPVKAHKPNYGGYEPKIRDRQTKTYSEKARAAVNMHNNGDPNNPELGTDFRTAMIKVLQKMNENSDDPANEVLKLLVSGEGQLNEEVGKLEITRPDYIQSKIKNILKKKVKTLENIVNKTDEEFQRKCPFVPTVNLGHTNKKKRHINEFMKDQLGYVRKTNDKVERVHNTK